NTDELMSFVLAHRDAKPLARVLLNFGDHRADLLRRLDGRLNRGLVHYTPPSRSSCVLAMPSRARFRLICSKSVAVALPASRRAPNSAAATTWPQVMSRAHATPAKRLRA